MLRLFLSKHLKEISSLQISQWDTIFTIETEDLVLEQSRQVEKVTVNKDYVIQVLR